MAHPFFAIVRCRDIVTCGRNAARTSFALIL
jgi:hypothetical protein